MRLTELETLLRNAETIATYSSPTVCENVLKLVQVIRVQRITLRKYETIAITNDEFNSSGSSSHYFAQECNVKVEEIAGGK